MSLPLHLLPPSYSCFLLACLARVRSGLKSDVFARALHDAWGVGSALCNNGVLVLIATADRTMFVSTGSGAKQVLTNAKLERIMSAVKTGFRDGNYDTHTLYVRSPDSVGRACVVVVG
jgi:hypothetical protein